MLIVVVPILINKDVFEPSYNDLKFTVQKPQSLFHQSNIKTLFYWWVGSGVGLAARSLVSMVCAVDLGSPTFLGTSVSASSTWLCPPLYLFPDLCFRCPKGSYPELPGLGLLTQTWRSEHPSSSSCLDMILEGSPGTMILLFIQLPAPSREGWLTHSLPSPGPTPAGPVSPAGFPTVMDAASRSFSTYYSKQPLRLVLAIKMKAISHSWWRALPPLDVSTVTSKVTSTSTESSSVGCWHVWDLTWPWVHLLLAFLFNLGVLRSSLHEPQFQDMNYGDCLCFWEFGNLWRPVKPFFQSIHWEFLLSPQHWVQPACFPRSLLASWRDIMWGHKMNLKLQAS